MRKTSLVLAGVAAVAAWTACWQEWRLVELRRDVEANQTGLQEARGTAKALTQQVTAMRTREHQVRDHAAAVKFRLDRLKELLAEREEAIADAREAAEHLKIKDGSREMEEAIEYATRDLETQIALLAGPDAMRRPTISANLPPGVQIAPAPVVPDVLPPSPPPAPPAAPPTEVAVNVAVNLPENLPAPAEPQPAYAVDPFGLPPVNALGVTVGNGRTKKAKPKPGQQAKLFAASAGIPMTGTPLGAQVTRGTGLGAQVGNSPLLLIQQRSGPH